MSLRDLVETLEATKEAIKEADSTLKELKRFKEQAEQQLIDEMLEQGVKSAQIGGKTYYHKNKTRVSIKAPKREELKALLIKLHLEEFIKPTVNQAQVQAFVSEQFKNHQPLPAGLEECLHIYREPTLGSRKS